MHACVHPYCYDLPVWLQLINYLKVVHGKGPFVVNVFTKACDLLQKQTYSREATSIALQEWKVIEALRIYLPSPLSGLLPEEIATASQMYGNMSSSLFDPQAHGEEAEAAHARAKRLVQIKEYKVGLMQLPPSFFVLCANLCFIDEGKSACFSEGFLRRALDKITVLNSKFIRHNLKFMPGGKDEEQWQRISVDLVACLRLVGAAANFSHPRKGSANDLILHELYETISLCKNAICWKLHTQAPRDEEIVLVAYEVLAELAQDTYRINKLFEKFDLYHIVAVELSMCEGLPERGARSAVRIIHRSCFGLTSDYIARMIAQLREPLTKVARLFPQLHNLVKETQWTLTKCSMIYRSATGVMVEDMLGGEHEDYIRTGNQQVLQDARNSYDEIEQRRRQQYEEEQQQGQQLRESEKERKPQQDRGLNVSGEASRLGSFDFSGGAAAASGSAKRATAAAGSRNGTGGESGGLLMAELRDRLRAEELAEIESTRGVDIMADLSDKEQQQQQQPQREQDGALQGPRKGTSTAPTPEEEEAGATARHALEQSDAGKYIRCGVSSCGSLRLEDDGPLHTHGAMSGLTQAQREQQQLQMTFSDPDVLGVSKLSARGSPGLQQRVQVAKGKAGFAEIQKVSVFDYDSKRHDGSVATASISASARASAPGTSASPKTIDFFREGVTSPYTSSTPSVAIRAGEVSVKSAAAQRQSQSQNQDKVKTVWEGPSRGDVENNNTSTAPSSSSLDYLQSPHSVSKSVPVGSSSAGTHSGLDASWLYSTVGSPGPSPSSRSVHKGTGGTGYDEPPTPVKSPMSRALNFAGVGGGGRGSSSPAVGSPLTLRDLSAPLRSPSSPRYQSQHQFASSSHGNSTSMILSKGSLPGRKFSSRGIASSSNNEPNAEPKIRAISVAELPQLLLTRPPK